MQGKKYLMGSVLQNSRLLQAVKVDNNLKSAVKALKRGAEADLLTGMNRTMLFYAAQHGNGDMVDLLLAHKADPNKLDEEGFGPLHEAVEGGHLEIAERLIAAGADIHAQDKQSMLGMTPLHVAFNADARDERTERVTFLLEKGVDDSLTDTAGRTAMAAGRERMHDRPFAGEVLEYMKEWKKNQAAFAFAAARMEEDAQVQALQHVIHHGTEADIAVPKLNIRRRGGPQTP